MVGQLPMERHSIDKMKLWGQGKDIGDPVHAGVNVSQDTALRLTVVTRCIQLIADTIAGLPADAVRKQGDIRIPVDRPPMWLTQPNPEQNWFEFAERVEESLLMDGNAFILISATDLQGFPSELWVLHPGQMDVRYVNPTIMAMFPNAQWAQIAYIWGGNTLLNKFSPANPTGELMHIRLTTAGGLRGLSPLDQAKQALGIGLAAEKFGATFYGRGQTMSGIIQLPAAGEGGVRASKEHIDLMREQWEAAHSGTDQAHRPGILTGGATWQGITIAPDQAQFLETRKFQVEEIARLYGVPAHLVGLEEKDSSWGTGIAAMSEGFVRYTLLPHIIRLEKAFSALLPRGQFVRMDQRALLRGTTSEEIDAMIRLVMNGLMNRDEARALLDLPPVPQGSKYLLPLNEQIVGATPAPPPTQPPAQEVPA